MVEEQEMLQASKSCRSPEALCSRLMDLALVRGASDNVTVVVIKR